MTISIYSPEVLATAREDNTTELQAYRKLKSAETLTKLLDRERNQNIRYPERRQSFLEWLFNVSPDWRNY